VTLLGFDPGYNLFLGAQYIPAAVQGGILRAYQFTGPIILVILTGTPFPRASFGSAQFSFQAIALFDGDQRAPDVLHEVVANTWEEELNRVWDGG
jgi:hypothetical protein